MKKFWIGLALGVVAGGVVVSLLTPQSGKSTRKKLKRGFQDFGDDLSDAADYLKEQAERLSKETQRLVRRKGEPLNDAVEAVRSFAETSARKFNRVSSRPM